MTIIKPIIAAEIICCYHLVRSDYYIHESLLISSKAAQDLSAELVNTYLNSICHNSVTTHQHTKQ